MRFRNSVNCLFLMSLMVTLCAVANGGFPDDPKPCKHGDEKCIGKIIEFLAKEKFAGDDSLNLSAIDPIPVKKLHIKQGSDSPVNIDLLFTNNVGIGLKTAKFIKAKGFGKDLKTKHEIVFKTDIMALQGDYKISGKVLVLPIRGEGKSKITMFEPLITIKWVGTPVEKNGETYMKMEKFAVDLEPKDFKFELDNLFNDKTLSDNMNKLLNDNWKEIYPEIRVALTQGLATIAHKVIQGVFDKYPYDKLFSQ
ncbi:protein takeout-like [Musca autumnalis]|uniref:protein takeout-like n=1 Tax=Musca autumnalis TaxID=221902 RepID=UPI003CEDD936